MIVSSLKIFKSCISSDTLIPSIEHLLCVLWFHVLFGSENMMCSQSACSWTSQSSQAERVYLHGLSKKNQQSTDTMLVWMGGQTEVGSVARGLQCLTKGLCSFCFGQLIGKEHRHAFSSSLHVLWDNLTYTQTYCMLSQLCLQISCWP
jgi:hypothetical protein